MSAPELLPCPFCGGKAGVFMNGREAACINEKCAGWKLNRCTPDEWNTRAAQPTPDPRVLALVEAVEYGERMCRLDFSRHIDNDSEDFSQAVWDTWQRMRAALAAWEA